MKCSTTGTGDALGNYPSPTLAGGQGHFNHREEPTVNPPDLEMVQRITRATCTELHTVALETGYLVRARRDPGQYRYKAVWPVVFAACSTGLIAEVES